MSDQIQTREMLLDKLGENTREFIAKVILSNQKIANELQISTIDLQCVNIIELLGGEATPGQIAKNIHLTTGGVTIMLDRLEKKGYIERRPNPDDRRSIIIKIPEERVAKLHLMYKSRGIKLDKILSKFNNEELSIIIHFFSEMNKNA